MGMTFDFAQFAERLGLGGPESDDAASARERADSLARAREWRHDVRSAVPNWRHADWRNHEWASRVDARLRRQLEAWVPLALGDDGRVTPRGSVLVCAPSGLGKSTGVYASVIGAVNAVCSAVEGPRSRFSGWCQVAWVTEAQLVLEAAQRRTELYRRAVASPVLVLDELGLACGHVAQVGATPIVMALLAERYDRGYSTTATSGVSSRVLAERYGAGAMRRLCHGGSVIEVGW